MSKKSPSILMKVIILLMLYVLNLQHYEVKQVVVWSLDLNFVYSNHFSDYSKNKLQLYREVTLNFKIHSILWHLLIVMSEH